MPVAVPWARVPPVSRSKVDEPLEPSAVTISNEALPPRTFLFRALRNLKQLYTSANDLERSLRTIRWGGGPGVGLLHPL